MKMQELFEGEWYGYVDGKYYVGQVSKVDGKLFASPGTNTGPFETKKEAQAERAAMEKANAKGWAYAKVFQVKNKAIILV
jgi:hypothetical protein